MKKMIIIVMLMTVVLNAKDINVLDFKFGSTEEQVLKGLQKAYDSNNAKSNGYESSMTKQDYPQSDMVCEKRRVLWATVSIHPEYFKTINIKTVIEDIRFYIDETQGLYEIKLSLNSVKILNRRGVSSKLRKKVIKKLKSKATKNYKVKFKNDVITITDKSRLDKFNKAVKKCKRIELKVEEQLLKGI